MLNNIEIEFEDFMQMMYGTQTISQAQEADMEKSFLAGVYVCLNILHSLDDDDKTFVVYYQGRPLHPKLMIVSCNAPEKFCLVRSTRYTGWNK